jgi:hypothetical protein
MPKVLLIGWDAADWKVIHPLLDGSSGRVSVPLKSDFLSIIPRSAIRRALEPFSVCDI